MFEPEIAKQDQNTDLPFTGERHMTEQLDQELALGQIEHMVRYAFVAPFALGKKVLDIASGSGYGSQYLALQGATEVVAVEIDSEAIKYAQKHHSHPAVRFVQSDAHAVPQLENAAFDVIVSFETIEHLLRPRDFLLELRRLLKPGGQLFLSCPNDYRDSPWISEFHLHKFKFQQFRDLVINVFGETVFLGQHNVLASCLLKPVQSKSCFSQFDSYRSPLPESGLGIQYIDRLSPIEGSEGYLAVVGVEPELIENHISVSQDAYEVVVKSQHYSSTENSRLRSDIQATGHRLLNLQEQFQVEKDTWKTHLQTARTELEDFQAGLRKTQAALEQTQAVLEQTQANLKQVQTELRQTRATVDSMKSSKFWKLRRRWFQLKQALGFADSDG